MPGLIPRALEYDSTPKTPISGKSPFKNNEKSESSNEKFLAGYNSLIAKTSKRFENENINPSDVKQNCIQTQETNNQPMAMGNKSPLIATPKKIQKIY